MSYKEFVLLYTTLILGLACTNIFYGLGEIIHEWKRIKIGWECILSPAILLMTIIDFWFHAFLFPYRVVNGNIMFFLIFLFPPIILFFTTLIAFPSESAKCTDYSDFFQKILRASVFAYGLAIFSTLIQIYFTHFMLPVFLPLLSLFLIICVILYLTNSVKLYKILASTAFVINLIRWGFEGIYLS